MKSIYKLIICGTVLSLFACKHQVDHSRASPSKDAAPNLVVKDPREENLKLPKTDPNTLPAPKADISLTSLAGQSGISISPDWAANIDYFEFAICQQQAPFKCQPERGNPRAFNSTPHNYYDAPEGPVTVFVRPCVTYFLSTNQGANCGAYETYAQTIPDGNNRALDPLLAEYNDLTDSLVRMCVSIRSVMHDYLESYPQNKNFIDAIERYLRETTPEACANTMANAEMERLTSVAIGKEGARLSDGTIAIIASGSATILALVFAGVSHYKYLKYMKKVSPQARGQLQASQIEQQKKAFDPDVVQAPTPKALANLPEVTPGRKLDLDHGNTQTASGWKKARNAALLTAGLAAIATAIFTGVESSEFRLAEGSAVGQSSRLSERDLAAGLEKLWERIKVIRKRLDEVITEIATLDTSYRARPQAIKEAAVHRQQKTRDRSPSQAFSLIFASDPQLVWGRNGVVPEDEDAWERTGVETNQRHTLAMNRIKNLGEKFPAPEAVVINGDLTAFGHPWQWRLFERLYHSHRPDGLPERVAYPIFPGLGNHDYANNVGDCWGPRLSAFGDGNWCANNSVNYIRRFIENNSKFFVGFDPGSVAYSWDMHDMHFVQLHNYPDYQESAIGIEPSLAWLRQDLANATAAGKKSVLNFHDPYFSDELLELIAANTVVAVFTGHYHELIGDTWAGVEENARSVLGDSPSAKKVIELKIPFLSCGSASFNRFLYTYFGDKWMRVTSISSATGQPVVLTEQLIPYRL